MKFLSTSGDHGNGSIAKSAGRGADEGVNQFFTRLIKNGRKKEKRRTDTASTMEMPMLLILSWTLLTKQDYLGLNLLNCRFMFTKMTLSFVTK